jgi:sensor domain CHASE-containing protein
LKERKVSTLAIVIAICIPVVLSIFFWSRQRAASRRRAIRQYADEHNFTFLGISFLTR